MEPKKKYTAHASIYLDVRAAQKKSHIKNSKEASEGKTGRPKKSDPDSGKLTKEGVLYPVKLQISYRRKQKFYRLIYTPEKTGSDFTDNQKFWIRRSDNAIAMTKLEHGIIEKARTAEPYKTMKLYLTTQVQDAENVIAAIQDFSFDEFEARFFEKSQDNRDIFTAISNKAKTLRNDGRISTAVVYENTLNSLKDYTAKTKMSFNDLSVKILKEYERWMLSRKVGKDQTRSISKTTVSMYLRALRAVFNENAPEGIQSPFGKGKYIIPKWNHNKRALTQAEVGKIAGYPVEKGTMQHKYRDLWIFSYLCNGINFKDIANLRYSNIRGDTIVYERAKTSNSNSESIYITVIITRQIGRIIDTWSRKDSTGDSYLFDILRPGLTAEQQYRAIQQAVKTTNKYMRGICNDLNISESTTYVARHSFASVLKRSGASVEFISESLGHRSITTTQNYLADFEIEEKQKWAESLLPDPIE